MLSLIVAVINRKTNVGEKISHSQNIFADIIYLDVLSVSNESA